MDPAAGTASGPFPAIRRLSLRVDVEHRRDSLAARDVLTDLEFADAASPDAANPTNMADQATVNAYFVTAGRGRDKGCGWRSARHPRRLAAVTRCVKAKHQILYIPRLSY